MRPSCSKRRRRLGKKGLKKVKSKGLKKVKSRVVNRTVVADCTEFIFEWNGLYKVFSVKYTEIEV